jgi:prepilin-type N-terminal cleavage/methylation domain-containing protein
MRARASRPDAGFSLAELLVAMAVMLVISGAAVSALLKMTSAQATIWNRTQMHSGIRGATEVLQQEVGQAGRIALPAAMVSTAAALTAGTRTVGIIECPTTTACATASVSGLFIGEQLVFDVGVNEETVTLTAVTPATNTITAVFAAVPAGPGAHASGVAVRALGAFATGIIPPLASPSSYTNGSTGTVLKLYGDINADGNMVYVEYTCDTASGNLYRNSMAWNAAAPSLAATASQILLGNVTANPDGSPCFTYQTQAVAGVYYVTDVAITLTVQTQIIDPVTRQFQTETKALLNVSPRNVFNVWQLASLGITNRIQPIPQSVALLLP